MGDIMSKRKILRVQCFGDSLTHGYINMHLAHPYKLNLERLLKAKYKDLDVKVNSKGWSGVSPCMCVCWICACALSRVCFVDMHVYDCVFLLYRVCGSNHMRGLYK